MDTAKILVSLLSFWVLLIILTNAFDIDVLENKPDIDEVLNSGSMTPNELRESVIKEWLDDLSGVPIIRYIVPVLKLMTFQYSTELGVIIPIILWMVSMLTIFVILDTLPFT